MTTQLDQCPQCGSEFHYQGNQDETYSSRQELSCACGKTRFCQQCEAPLCAHCEKPLCNLCFVEDADGETYCWGHIDQSPVGVVVEEAEQLAEVQ